MELTVDILVPLGRSTSDATYIFYATGGKFL